MPPVELSSIGSPDEDEDDEPSEDEDDEPSDDDSVPGSVELDSVVGSGSVELDDSVPCVDVEPLVSGSRVLVDGSSVVEPEDSASVSVTVVSGSSPVLELESAVVAETSSPHAIPPARRRRMVRPEEALVRIMINRRFPA
jgi:hypothetical protein